MIAHRIDVGLRPVGRIALAVGCGVLGIVALQDRHGSDALRPLVVGDLAGLATGGALVLLSLGLSFRATRAWSARGLVVYWLTWLVLGHRFSPRDFTHDPTSLVAWLEVLVLAMTAAVLSPATESLDRRGDQTGDRTGSRFAALPFIATRIVFGVMLVVFGLVHLTYPAAISAMIPQGFPARTVWPWLTGTASCAAGIALVFGLGARLAAVLVGAMFVSWLPLVHVARLIAQPSRDEWVFAATALSLAGAAWMLARPARAGAVQPITSSPPSEDAGPRQVS
jgi:uncharacterized membrane protein YphA (DoxX/SURF4 family)